MQTTEQLIDEMDRAFELTFKDSLFDDVPESDSEEDEDLFSMIHNATSNDDTHPDTWFPKHSDCKCDGYHNRCAKKATTPMCKYDLGCTRTDCMFMHSDGRVPKTQLSEVPVNLGQHVPIAKALQTSKIPLPVSSASVIKSWQAFEPQHNVPGAPVKKCKYDLKCTRANCHFSHSDGRVPQKSQVKAPGAPIKKCRFGDRCTNAKCGYSH